MSRHRNYCFTSFIDPFEHKLTPDNTKYVIVGREVCPDTGRVHFQGYVEFCGARTIQSAKALLGECHLEPRRGTPAEAAEYCRKDGNVILEFGIISKQGKRNDLVAIFEEIKEQGFDEVSIAERHCTAWAMYRKAFREFHQLHEDRRMWRTEVRIYYGPTGTGKTFTAIRVDGCTPVEYVKDGRFFEGYNGEDNVLFDEFVPDEMPVTKWLQLCDEYPHRVNCKGGTRNWKPRLIVFTTNDLFPQSWYSGMHSDAFRRRVTEFREFEGLLLRQAGEVLPRVEEEERKREEEVIDVESMVE